MPSRPNLLLLDHHDSFTDLLADYLVQAGAEVHIRSACMVPLAQAHDGLVLSPGAGAPSRWPATKQVLHRLVSLKPVLGVCLGHQMIAEHYGAKLRRLRKPTHGETCRIWRGPDALLFHGLPSSFSACRYHSLAVDPATLPSAVRVTAQDEEGTVMAFEHLADRCFGLQFHPEAYRTHGGIGLLTNFVEACRETRDEGERMRVAS